MKIIQGSLGFTKLELLFVSTIIAIFMAIGIPSISSITASYRLKSAARDLYSNMHLAKMTAIRQNKKCKLTYSLNPDKYTIDCLNKTVVLSDYGGGIRFQGPGGKTFNKKFSVTFNSRGLSDQLYAYLTNNGNTAYYRVGPLWSGVIRMRKWNGKSWE